jgi:hypothetical protein
MAGMTTLAQVTVPRPEATLANQQYLCLDTGYIGYPVSKIGSVRHL